MEHERILTADWDDIVFENRNKEYGAYWLRKKYSKHINTALAITIGATLLLFSIPYIKQLIDKSTDEKRKSQLLT
jgi:periplasmic protein TonB